MACGGHRFAHGPYLEGLSLKLFCRGGCNFKRSFCTESALLFIVLPKQELGLLLVFAQASFVSSLQLETWDLKIVCIYSLPRVSDPTGVVPNLMFGLFRQREGIFITKPDLSMFVPGPMRHIYRFGPLPIAWSQASCRLYPSCTLTMSPAGAVAVSGANFVMHGESTFLNNSAVSAGGERVLLRANKTWRELSLKESCAGKSGNRRGSRVGQRQWICGGSTSSCQFLTSVLRRLGRSASPYPFACSAVCELGSQTFLLREMRGVEAGTVPCASRCCFFVCLLPAKCKQRNSTGSGNPQRSFGR